MNCGQIEMILSIAQLFVATFGGAFAIFLYKKSLEEKRQAFIFSIYEKLYCDVEIRDILYIVDKNGNELNELQRKIADSDTPKIVQFEKELDKTLRYFDYIGNIFKNGYLTKKDLKMFEYELKTILSYPIVKQYLNYLNEINVNLTGLEEIEKYLNQ